MTLPYLAYAITVLEAGYRDNALRRAPVAYMPLARELRLRNAGTGREMLNLDQAEELAGIVRSLSAEEQEAARAYAQAAESAVRGYMPKETPLALDEQPATARPGGQRSVWTLPALDLLELPGKGSQIGESVLRSMEQRLQATINSFKMKAEVRPEYTRVGPRVIRFGVLPTGIPVMQGNAPRRDGAGNIIYEQRTTTKQITARQKDFQGVLEATTIRMEDPVPGTPYVGIEVPNPYPNFVALREVLENKEYQAARAASKLVFALGRDVAGNIRFCDIARAPHVLVAGATNSGKSVLLNALIGSILTQATPDDVRMLLVDPKMVELTLYNGIRHLLRPVVTDVEKVVPLLSDAIREMERRYTLFSKLGVRNLAGYRKLRAERLARGDTTLANLPAILIIIDELADLMMTAPDEVEDMICRLAQLARAIGIHLVIATQRPSVDVITGKIKANIPTRISFTVSSSIDSRTILDMGGAERLLGYGDLLYLPADARVPERIQGAFVSDEDAEALATYWQAAQPSAGVRIAEKWADEDDEDEGDNLEKAEEERNEHELKEAGNQSSDDPDEALIQRIIVELLPGQEWISASRFKRTFGIGDTRAGRIMDKLAARGLVSATAQGPRNERRVLLANNEQLDSEQDEAEELSLSLESSTPHLNDGGM